MQPRRITLVTGLSPLAAQSSPAVLEFELPTDAGPAVARVYYHPIDLADLATLREAGFPAELFRREVDANGKATMVDPVPDPLDRFRRNLALITACGPGDPEPAGIIDRERGWENLRRTDGTEWVYRVPKLEEVGTRADDRVRLAQIYPFLVDAVVVSAALANLEHRARVEGNSATSSGGTTTPGEAKSPRKSRK